jgi:hypothetical protein
MKATLEFDLSDFDKDDNMEFKMAVKASNYYWALYDFKNAKKTLEWELDANAELDRYEVLDKVFQKFFEIIEDHNITFEH